MNSILPMAFAFTIIISLTGCGLSPTSTPISASLTEKPVSTESISLNTPTSEINQTEKPFSTESIDITSTPTLLVIEPTSAGVVHFLTGHGEFNLNGNGERSYNQVKLALEAKGYSISTLNLLESNTIPDDAKVIVIAGPSTPVTRVEVNQLQTFVDGGGSLVVLEEPAMMSDFRDQADPLAEYLEAFWDIKLGNDFIIDPNFDQPYPVVSDQYGQHAITDKVGNVTSIYYSARSVTPIEGTDLSLVELVKSSEQTWAETDLAAVITGMAAGTLRPNQPDEEVDLLGPVTLVVVGEDLKGSKVAVFGDSDFVSDTYINESGNLNLFVETIDWAMKALPSPSLDETITPHTESDDWIAFASMDQNRWGLYLVRPDGSGLTHLEGEMEVSSEALISGLKLSWSPDGQRIAFPADYEGNQDIFVADLSTGTFKRISGTDEDDWNPTWDPKGEWIAFASKDRIMIVRPDGTGLQTLIDALGFINDFPAPSYAAHPSYSPNGRYLTFVIDIISIIGQTDIFVKDFESPDKDASKLIKHPDANDYYPTFAPVGFKMAYTSAASMDYDYDLFFTDMKSEPVKISNHIAQFPFSFTWSPDGNQIAYSVQIGDRTEIFIVEPGGSEPIQITGEPLSGETIGYSEDGNRAPSWSADSSRIAFQSNRDGNWEIYVMNADGSGQINLTNSSAMDISPAWQP